MIVFFDASALIYPIEGKERFASRIRTELAAVIRVATGLKTPDAMRAASCLQLGPGLLADGSRLAISHVPNSLSAISHKGLEYLEDDQDAPCRHPKSRSRPGDKRGLKTKTAR